MPTDTPAAPWRPPARPIPPPDGYTADGDTYTVPGVATVTVDPYRSRRTAKAFAERIAQQPAAYLAVLVGLCVPGSRRSIPLVATAARQGVTHG